MMRIIRKVFLSKIAAVALVLSSSFMQSHAETENINKLRKEVIWANVSLKGALLTKQVDSLLRLNNLALMAVGDFISANPDVDPSIAHARMKRYQRAGVGLRSILAIGPDGYLMHDSYNLPAPKFNLGDRIYVREAVRQETSDLRVNASVKGRQSGLPFIPITRAVFDVSGSVTNVVVGIVSPDALLPEDNECALCMSAVLTQDLDTLISRPAGWVIQPVLIERIEKAAAGSGLELVPINGARSLVYWHKNSFTGVITITAEWLQSDQ